ADLQLGVVRNLAADIAESLPGHGARDTADDLAVELDLVRRSRVGDFELAQQTVRVAAVVQARDRLLARIAALRERDVRLLEPRLRRQNGLVELLPPGRRTRVNP